jgi:hypothetical protein
MSSREQWAARVESRRALIIKALEEREVAGFCLPWSARS